MKSKIGAISSPTKWTLVQQKLKKKRKKKTLQLQLLQFVDFCRIHVIFLYARATGPRLIRYTPCLK